MTDSGPRAADQACWSGPQKAAWDKIVRGEIADFEAELGELDPANAAGWTEKRTLSSDFLRAILFEKKWSDQVPPDGLRIRGARWTDELHLAHAKLKWPLCLEKCRFESPVNLTGLSSEERLSLSESVYCGKDDRPGLTLDGATLRRLNLSRAVFRPGCRAKGAVVHSLLDLSGMVLEGTLDLERAKAGCLLLRNASGGEIGLKNFEVDQDIDVSGTTLSGKLSMEDVRAGQDILLGGNEERPSAYQNGVSLLGGVVGGSVDLSGATVDGELDMNGAEIRKHLFLRAHHKSEKGKGETIFKGPVDLSYAVVKGHVELMAARFRTLRMTGIQIEENLAAGRYATQAGLDCTTFGGELNLESARIKGSANFTWAHFEKADFTAARFESSVFLNGAAFTGDLVMAGIRVARNLLFQDDRGRRPQCVGLSLENAVVEGTFALTAICSGPVNLSGLEAGQNLFMCAKKGKTGAEDIEPPKFEKPVDLSYATVSGVLDLNRATFGAELLMSNIEVRRDVRITPASCGAIALTGGDVKGSVIVDMSSEAKLDMKDLHVGQDLDIRGSFAAAVNLSQARIDRSLDASAAEISGTLDLSAAAIGAQLRLRVPKSPGELDLRDARTASLQVFDPRLDADGQWRWPPRGSVQLDGFTFDRLGGYRVDPAEEMIERPAAWLRSWLALNEPYSPQPYEHLAGVLRQAGQAEKTNLILYYGRRRARSAPWESPPAPPAGVPEKPVARKPIGPWFRWAVNSLRYRNRACVERLGWELKVVPRWLGLGVLQWTIGYGIGYRYFLALGWALIFTLIGVLVLGSDPLLSEKGEVMFTSWQQKLAFSFDQLLPIVELNEEFAAVKLAPGADLYFYAHKLFGFLLGTFILAGIAGLTQRSSI